MSASNPQLLQRIEALHVAVDQAADRLVAVHGARLNCHQGCADCCRDELTVFEIEAAVIVARCGPVLQQAPHPAGGCAFLDPAGACRIYAHRPYVCRTQGLPLRWIEQVLAEDGALEVLEYRDICPLNDEGEVPIELLPPEVIWTVGPVEEQLADLQAGIDSAAGQEAGPGSRVALRALFSG